MALTWIFSVQVEGRLSAWRCKFNIKGNPFNIERKIKPHPQEHSGLGFAAYQHARTEHLCCRKCWPQKYSVYVVFCIKYRPMGTWGGQHEIHAREGLELNTPERCRLLPVRARGTVYKAVTGTLRTRNNTKASQSPWALVFYIRCFQCNHRKPPEEARHLHFGRPTTPYMKQDALDL
jgi:hypothetical protein